MSAKSPCHAFVPTTIGSNTCARCSFSKVYHLPAKLLPPVKRNSPVVGPLNAAGLPVLPESARAAFASRGLLRPSNTVPDPRTPQARRPRVGQQASALPPHENGDISSPENPAAPSGEPASPGVDVGAQTGRGAPKRTTAASAAAAAIAATPPHADGDDPPDAQNADGAQPDEGAAALPPATEPAAPFPNPPGALRGRGLSPQNAARRGPSARALHNILHRAPSPPVRMLRRHTQSPQGHAAHSPRRLRTARLPGEAELEDDAAARAAHAEEGATTLGGALASADDVGYSPRTRRRRAARARQRANNSVSFSSHILSPTARRRTASHLARSLAAAAASPLAGAVLDPLLGAAIRTGPVLPDEVAAHAAVAREYWPQQQRRERPYCMSPSQQRRAWGDVEARSPPKRRHLSTDDEGAAADGSGDVDTPHRPPPHRQQSSRWDASLSSHPGMGRSGRHAADPPVAMGHSVMTSPLSRTAYRPPSPSPTPSPPAVLTRADLIAALVDVLDGDLSPRSFAVALPPGGVLYPLGDNNFGKRPHTPTAPTAAVSAAGAEGAAPAGEEGADAAAAAAAAPADAAAAAGDAGDGAPPPGAASVPPKAPSDKPAEGSSAPPLGNLRADGAPLRDYNVLEQATRDVLLTRVASLGGTVYTPRWATAVVDELWRVWGVDSDTPDEEPLANLEAQLDARDPPDPSGDDPTPKGIRSGDGTVRGGCYVDVGIRVRERLGWLMEVALAASRNPKQLAVDFMEVLLSTAAVGNEEVWRKAPPPEARDPSTRPPSLYAKATATSVLQMFSAGSGNSKWPLPTNLDPLLVARDPMLQRVLAAEYAAQAAREPFERAGSPPRAAPTAVAGLALWKAFHRAATDEPAPAGRVKWEQCIEQANVSVAQLMLSPVVLAWNQTVVLPVLRQLRFAMLEGGHTEVADQISAFAAPIAFQGLDVKDGAVMLPLPSL